MGKTEFMMVILTSITFANLTGCSILELYGELQDNFIRANRLDGRLYRIRGGGWRQLVAPSPAAGAATSPQGERLGMKPRQDGHEARPMAGWLEAGEVEGGLGGLPGG